MAEAAGALYLMHSVSPSGRRKDGPRQDDCEPGDFPGLVLLCSRCRAGHVSFAALAGAGRLIERFSDPDPLAGRREIFQAARAMIAQSCRWKGYGLGTFASVYPQFAEFDSGKSIDHAHSDWLEWTAEGGWPYVAAWLALAAWSIGPAIRSVWGLGVVGVFLHALVDYPFARFGVSAWAFLLIGLLAREDMPRQNNVARE